MKSAIQMLKVCQSFRTGFWLKSTQVLTEVSFDVPEGSIFGFLGANGAGKTTLIHLIAGIRSPSSGHVSIFGFEAASREARANIGYLPERPYFHEHLTGEGLLTHYGILSGMDRHEIREQIPLVLGEVGMLRARGVELKNFSKGMLQRIGIAQALIHQPSLLILDEPMSGLDPLGRKEIRELILKLSESGKTIFFTSHVIADVGAMGSHLALLERGRLIESGPVSQFEDRGELQSVVEGLFERGRSRDA